MLGMPERALTQEVGIEFSKGSWKKQLNQAKRQKKLIFLDCHTKWCGFCKVLAQYVFTDPEVARFYNQHFVNVEMDMEEGVGVELVKDTAFMLIQPCCLSMHKANWKIIMPVIWHPRN